MVKDLRTVIDSDCSFEVLTFDDEDGKKAFNHTASHVMAQAVKRLYPNAKLTIGPSIENGFYYDFDIDTHFTQDDLDKIEKEMKAIIKENYPIEKFELPVDEAVKLTRLNLLRNTLLKASLSVFISKASLRSFAQVLILWK